MTSSTVVQANRNRVAGLNKLWLPRLMSPRIGPSTLACPRLAVVALGLLLPTLRAGAQTPTVSLRLTEVNSVALVGHGVTAFTVAPGDQLTVKVFLRDWSPNGEMAAAVQAELNSDSFTSGTSGTIRPLAYETTTLRGEPNSANVLVDVNDPDFIHLGRQTVAFADSSKIVPGYRWISVLFGKIGPIAKQDGRDFYMGTVRLAVSKDAAGTFTFNPTVGQEHCGLLDFDGKPISETGVEALTLTVDPQRTTTWIVSSTPECGSVDARSPDRGSTGIDRINLRMSYDGAAISQEDFTITSDHGEAPRIKSLKGMGRNVTLRFERPLPPESWTHITHRPSGTATRLGRFHGDVNRDTFLDFTDLADFLAELNEKGTAPMRSGDLDGSGRVNAADVLVLLTLICSD